MNEQIEAIRNEIERMQEIHERNLKKPMERGRIGYAHGVVACCDRILSFIDSLPEEPDNGVDVTDFCKPIAPGIAQCIADHWWEMLDDDESSRLKISDSLEDAAEKYENEHTFHKYEGCYYSDITMSEAFKAGAKWQAEQEKDEWLKDRDGCFWDGVEEGKKAMEKQMMKDAVEGEIIKTDKHTSVRYKSFYGTDRYFYGIADKQFKPGGKVRIIIVKEDER